MAIASRRNSVRPVRAWWIAAAALAVAGGCDMSNMSNMPNMTGMSAKPAPVRRTSPSLVEDPCAERLGDICTRMLMYYVKNRELPPRLEDLSAMGSPGPLLLTCPVSGKPYLYHREGLAVAHSERRIVVQDATPVHGGTRWVIAADPAKPGKPRVIQVLRLSGAAELSEK